MEEIVKTATAIMEQLRMYSGWKFEGGAKGDVCAVAVVLANDKWQRVDVLLLFQKNDVSIKTTAWSEKFDPQRIQQIEEKLDFPIEKEQKDKTFTIIHHEPLGVLEHSVKGVLTECILPMVNAVAETIAE